MPDPSQWMRDLLVADRRYKLEAYIFVFEALNFAQDELGMGVDRPTEHGSEEVAETGTSASHRHLTGQQLCEAMRRFALSQFGYMAHTVLNHWGVRTTGDFGEIVFNLIRIGKMHKTPEDRREDFNDVFDLEAELKNNFKFTAEETK